MEGKRVEFLEACKCLENAIKLATQARDHFENAGEEKLSEKARQVMILVSEFSHACTIEYVKEILGRKRDASNIG